MQLCVNSIQNWASENGFKFSISKMVCIHFHQQYGFFLDPNILRGKKPIKVVKEAKFRGLIFDTTFKNHVHLKSSCQENSGYFATYWLGSGSYCHAAPVPCVSLLQIGLRMHCVWTGSSVCSKAIGSDPPSGLAYRIGVFVHISCSKSLHGGTRTVPSFF